MRRPTNSYSGGSPKSVDLRARSGSVDLSRGSTIEVIESPSMGDFSPHSIVGDSVVDGLIETGETAEDAAPSKSKCSIPLWLVFILQSVVVSGAFIAVILVLVLQQQSQYTDAVFREVDLHLQRSQYAITSPLTAREGRFKQLVDQFEKSPDMWYSDNMSQSTSPELQRFFNFSYFLCRNDPLVYAVYQHLRHSTLKHSNGDAIYGLAVMTTQLLTVQTHWDDSNLATAFVHPTYPLTYGYSLIAPLAVSKEAWSYRLRKRLVTSWGPGTVVYNSVTNEITVVSGLSYPAVINTTTQEATLTLYYGFNVSYMTNTVDDALLSPTSKLMLFDSLSGAIMATRNAGELDFNTVDNVQWNLTSFPDRSFISRFQDYINTKCRPADNCTFYAAEEGDEIVSIKYMTTEYGYKLHIFQITPRDYYFAAGERSALTGIVIGVVAAVVVLVSCVVIWFAVRGPIHRLRESMELAAVMRNDEVDDTSSVLTELDLLSQSFMQMNGKLLQARAFMPQSMLCGSDDDGDDDDQLVDEGSVRLEAGRTSVFNSQVITSGAFETGSRRGSTMSAIAPMNQRNRKSSMISISQRSTVSKMSHMKKGANVVSGLVPKRVSVLMINARGTHSLAATGGAAKLEREQVRLVELVERCARAEKGVVDAFQGDHFVLTFNAVRPVGGPARNAAIVGLSIEEGAQRDGLALGRFSMGLSVGRAYIGNVGSATMKKNCTVGSVYTNAAGLERLAKRVGRTCAAHGQAIGEVEIVAYCQLIGSLTVDADATRDTLYAIMGRMEGFNADEWLYEMEEAAKGNPYHAYNNALTHFIAGGQEKCLDALSSMDRSSLPPTLLRDVEELRRAAEGTGGLLGLDFTI